MIIKENIKVNENGELISAEQTIVKKISAEEFTQIYLKDNEEFYSLSKAESNILSICWLLSVYYSDNTLNMPGNKITFDKSFKTVIEQKTGLKSSTIYNTMASLVKKEMLLKNKDEKGTYYLNPKFFFKGRLTDRTNLIKRTIEYQLNQN